MSIFLGVKLSQNIRVNAAKGLTGRDLLDPPPELSGDASKVSKILAKFLRKIGNLTQLKQKKEDGGILGFLWDKGSQFVGWIAQSIWKFVSFSATAIWTWVIGRIEQLKQFNWNATDTELMAMVEGQNIALASLWGGVVGQGLGWLAGIAVGYGVAFLCPVIGGAQLARLIALRTGKEATEELFPQVVNALIATAGSFANKALIEFYINFRWWLKGFSPEQLEKFYGKETADFIRFFWGKDGQPNLSFNYQMDEAVEAIQNKAVKAFVENLLEESWDSFMEAGFIVAQQIDDAYSQSKKASEKAMGSKRSVEIVLNAEADPVNQEKLKLVELPQKQMIQTVESTLNTYRMIHNRDMGLVMGLPYEEYTRAKPQSLRLVIDMYSRKEPPYFKKTDDFVWATITIPDVKRSAVDWEKIKVAVGGVNGYSWGRFKAVANLSTGRRLILYAGSEKEATERVTALMSLSDAKLLTLNITEETKIGQRIEKPRLYKPTTRIYPGFFTVINREELLDPNQGRATTRKPNYRDARARIPLYLDKEPENAKDELKRVFIKGY